jgi:hypothetical protein
MTKHLTPAVRIQKARTVVLDGERPTTSSVIAIWSARFAQDDATKSDENDPSGLSGISLSYWTPHCQRTKLIVDSAFYNHF